MRQGLRARRLLVAAAVVAVGVAAYLVRDFVGEAIVRPLYVQLQLIVLYIRSIPQDAVWLVLIGVGLYIAFRAIRPRRDRARRPMHRTGDERPVADRLVLRWTIAARRNPYFRERLAELLARHLCRAVGVSPGRGRTAAGLSAALESRGVEVPEYLAAYLDEERSHRPSRRWSMLRRRAIEAEMRNLEDAVTDVERMVGVHERTHERHRDG